MVSWGSNEVRCKTFVHYSIEFDSPVSLCTVIGASLKRRQLKKKSHWASIFGKYGFAF